MQNTQLQEAARFLPAARRPELPRHVACEQSPQGRLRPQNGKGVFDMSALRVWYQPIVDLAAGAPDGVEALVRKQSPHQEVTVAADFLCHLDRRVLASLDLLVMERVLGQARDRLEGDGDPLRFHVNLPPAHLDNEMFLGAVFRLLAAHPEVASSLVFELTEGSPVDAVRMREPLDRLRSLGCQVALDDFGAGYSNLHYLTSLPLDYLKLDRRFVADLPHNGRATTLVRELLRLTRALDIRVIAEGIETHEQWVTMRELGCEMGQGYFLGRPGPDLPEGSAA